MAETFASRDMEVHFSNGAGEALFGGWLRLAEQSPVPPALLAYLRAHLDAYDNSIDFRSADWTALATETQRAFLEVLAESARAIVLGDPDTLFPEVNWSDELRLSWLARLAEIHAMAGVAIAAPAFTLPLNERDALLVDLERTYVRHSHLFRQSPNAVDAHLPLVDRLLTLTAQLERPGPHRLALAVEGLAAELAVHGRQPEAHALLDRARALLWEPGRQHQLAEAQSLLRELWG